MGKLFLTFVQLCWIFSTLISRYFFFKVEIKMVRSIAFRETDVITLFPRNH